MYINLFNSIIYRTYNVFFFLFYEILSDIDIILIHFNIVFMLQIWFKIKL